MHRHKRPCSLLNLCLLLLAITVTTSTAAAAVGADDLELLPAAGLRCESLVAPWGVDTMTPKLSWVPLVSDLVNQRGVQQVAFQVRVYSGQQVIWDSGVVKGNATFVQVPDQTIGWRELYSWNVIWSGCQTFPNGTCESGSSSGTAAPPSASATFATQVAPEEWLSTSSWLSCKTVGACDYLRSPVFTLPAAPLQAALFLATAGWVEPWINGVPAATGNAVLEGSWTQWNIRMPTTAYNVTSLLNQGSNSFGLVLGNGWWGHLGHRASASAYLSIQLLPDETMIYGTDPKTWRGSVGPIKADDIYNGELYSMADEIPGWSAPTADISGWDETTVVADPYLESAALSWQAVQPVVARRDADQLIPALTITMPSTAQFVVDFGLNSAGWTRLILPAYCPANTAIRLRHAENLFSNGTVDQGNLRSALQTDTLVCDGRSTVFTYEPRFTYHGFRYVGVEGWPVADMPSPTVENFFKVEVHNAVEWAEQDSYAVDYLPPSSLSVPGILSDVQDMIRRGQLSNLHGGVATDCPQRDERQGWMADASVSAESAINNFDMQAFYTSWLRTIVDSQRSAAVLNDCAKTSPIYPDCCGADTDTSPHVAGLFGYRPADPSWGAALDILYDLLLRYYNNMDYAKAMYPALTAYVDYLSRVAAVQGGLVTFAWYGDWLQPNQVASTAYVSQQTSAFNYLRSLRVAITAATVMGNTDDVAKYTNLYLAAADKYNAQFFNTTGSGCWGSGRQNEQVFPLYLGIQPGGPQMLKAFVNQCLLPAIAANNTHVDTGIIATKYLMPLLSRVGRTDVALAMALQEDFPSWGAMARVFGETTITEHWNPISNPSGNGMSSRNHPAFSSIGSWLYQAVLGVRLGDAATADFSVPGLPPSRDGASSRTGDGSPADGFGFTKAVVAPEHVTDSRLPSAAGGVRTARGFIAASWSFHKSDQLLVLNATFPVGVLQGEVRTPPASPWQPNNATIFENGLCAGATVWRLGQFYPYPCTSVIDARACGVDGDRVCLSVVSGAYSFVVK